MSLVDSPHTGTLPKLLARNARQWSSDPAMREKTRGIWQTWSWADYHTQVRDFALGLASLGFKRGEKLTVVGDNRPQLYFAQLAAAALGGFSVPVYQDSIATEIVYVLNHAEVSIVVAEDQEQVDKILSLRDQLPSLRWIVYDDPRGMQSYADHALIRSFVDVVAAGRTYGNDNPGYFDTELARGAPDDVAMIAYTSGTTGSPKGVMLTHRNMITISEGFVTMEGIRRGDNWLSYLPMAWVGDTTFTVGVGLVAGITANCPESPETVQRDLRELGPSGLVAPPRIWENMLTSIQVKTADATPLKRWVFAHFRRIAEQVELARSEGRAVPLGQRMWYALGEFLVYGPVRDQLGLRRARSCYTGGAPLGADNFRFFRSFGINLKQVYGATEASALIACQLNDEADPNSVGRTLPGVAVRVDDRGEVMVSGPNIFKGYFKQDEVTRETITADGWLKTGDAGFVDPRGHLVIIDRAKDVGKLADGTPFAPQFVENKLKFSPFIREAVSFGDGKPFVAAMVAIDLNTVGNWAERNNLAYTSFMDLSRKPEVATLIGEEIVKCNVTLPAAGQVRRFLLLNKELDADDAEMTRTRKVRRRFVAEKYASVIEAFYSGKNEVEVTMEITFEDGRKSTLTSTIALHETAPGAVQRAA
ncbi:AMP-binding protein [Reyranella sp. CPCC 100927]|uniref:AMP-binding protein n=1 Tax=Reyranella sp. CPCC 100927 TaxID=2599616 RepID=UPI0011B45EE9|nr:AMP-binding protein [Reyranella sp. CPCC 100927]TWT03905.1 long-chain fatty acid--CoA ligase [Reyranella sp. CPCC 100927]